MERFDVAVVGAGAAGSAAARSIVEAGRSCVVLERFPLGHAEGSSHGSARIFRLAYHHPDYVRMALHARDAWRELESASGTELLTTTGGIDIGPLAVSLTRLGADGWVRERDGWFERAAGTQENAGPR